MSELLSHDNVLLRQVLHKDKQSKSLTSVQYLRYREYKKQKGFGNRLMDYVVNN